MLSFVLTQTLKYRKRFGNTGTIIHLVKLKKFISSYNTFLGIIAFKEISMIVIKLYCYVTEYLRSPYLGCAAR
jgi:hypothetical protein